jgi:hypothetical protein
VRKNYILSPEFINVSAMTFALPLVSQSHGQAQTANLGVRPAVISVYRGDAPVYIDVTYPPVRYHITGRWIYECDDGKRKWEYSIPPKWMPPLIVEVGNAVLVVQYQHTGTVVKEVTQMYMDERKLCADYPNLAFGGKQ